MAAETPDESTLQQLVAAAREARRRAHAPYSGFAVGAALLDVAAGVDAALHLLAAAAREARRRAHAPYSGFAVGAALLDAQGRIHAGCNVENAAYPEGLCAEAVALGALVMAGGTRVVAAAVVGDAPQPVTPCGGCRQKLREFAPGDAVIVSANDQSILARHTLAGLLPASFGPDHLAEPPR